MHIDSVIKNYIDELAARQPTPGGGSAAALSGALGAALLEMVCNFTAGKEKYRSVEHQILEYMASLKKIRDRLSSLIDEDVKAYSAIREAFKKGDKKSIDNALKGGYDVCLKICTLSVDALNLAVDIADKGNGNLITDVGCAAELLKASFNCAVFNCEINIKGMSDKAFAQKERDALELLKEKVPTLYEDSVSKTKERMK